MSLKSILLIPFLQSILTDNEKEWRRGRRLGDFTFWLNL